jgi:hypothetical protein
MMQVSNHVRSLLRANPELSWKELPEKERSLLVVICEACKCSPRDLIDDPIPEKEEQSEESENARREFIHELSKPLYIRGKLARSNWYSSYEIGLLLDRSVECVEELKRGDTVNRGGKGK